MGARRLSPAECRLIRLAWDQGANLDQIAMLVGRSLRAIANHLHAVGCYRHKSRCAPFRLVSPRQESTRALIARDAGRRRERLVFNRRHAA